MARKYSPLFFLSLGASFVVALLIVGSILPLSVHLDRMERVPSAGPLLYHDFEDDGNSEYIRVVPNLDMSFTGILLHRANSEHIQQFNFKGFFSLQNMPGRKWLHIADYNGDHVDDLFVFHKWSDTLYVALVDMAALEILWDVPVATAPASTASPWDVYINDIDFTCLQKEGRPLLLFALFTGHALHPRGLYAFDVDRRQIVLKYETAVDIAEFRACDVDDDGSKEILVSTYASANYPIDSPMPNDNYSWLLFLNHEFEPLFAPKQMGPYASSSTAFVCLQPQSSPKIITVLGYGGTQPFSSRIIQWSLRGERLNDFPLYHMISPTAFVFPELKDRFYLYCWVPDKKLEVYDWQLQKRNELTFDDTFYTLEFLHAGRDSSYLVMVKGSEIAILNHNLHIKGRCSFPAAPSLEAPFLSVIKRKDLAVPSLFLSDGKVQYQFRIGPNPYFTFKSAVSIAIIILFLTGAYGLRMGGIWVFTALGYLISMIKNNPNATMILRPDGRILYHNRRVRELLNVGKSNERTSIKWLKDTNPQLQRKLMSMLNSHGRIGEEIVVLQDGREHKLALKTIPINLFRRPISYYVEIQENAAYPLSERLQLWAAALQRLAHDIKNPLSSMIFSLRAAQQQVRQLEIPEDQRQFLLKMLNSQVEAVEVTLKRTQSFLKVNQIIQPQFVKSDIHGCLQKSIANYQKYFNNGGSIQLITSFDESVPELICDPDQMEIMFNILIENAIDAMEGFGQLAITTLAQEDVVQSSQYVEITFRDTGRGIPPNIQAQVLKRRVSTKKENGSGIGLLLVRNIVETHGGMIHFKSDGDGTVFVVKLPILDYS